MTSRILLLLVLLLSAATLRAAEPPFEIHEGDRVLLLGDTLLEREGTYGYLETRMHEQFPDRHFTVRNLSWSGETPRGWSRASFDSPEKGYARLKEDIAKVRPTVVFLGFGMAASLQEMTDRSGDITFNPDPARYGEEPMSAARFKKELGELMDAIVKGAADDAKARDGTNDTGSARAPRAGSGASPEPSSKPGAPADSGKNDAARPGPVSPAGAPTTAREARALPISPENPISPEGSVRFVLLSPIGHEDLRAMRPGLPDPAPHNALLEQYAKAIEELAKERGGRFVPLLSENPFLKVRWGTLRSTDNGIHLTESGYDAVSGFAATALDWGVNAPQSDYWFAHPYGVTRKGESEPTQHATLRAAVVRKNELFFHQFRPANSTYLFGFRKHEQGQNAREMPMFDPLIAAAEAEIDRLKKAGAVAAGPLSAPTKGSSAPTGAQSDPTKAQSDPTKAQSGPTEAQSGPTEAQSDPTKAPSALTETARQPQNAESQAKNVALDPANAAGAPTNAASAPANALGAPANAIIQPKNAPPLPEFTVQEGYQIELWAQNPYLEKPTQMNWDPQGRLWVCSSSLYPQIEPGQAANDKILILEDTDRDGKADKSTVFADGLLIPTGVVPDLITTKTQRHEGDKGTAPSPSSSLRDLVVSPAACYVGQSTELLYFKDTDGDGKADEKRIVFSGFGTEDTHHIIHTLRWGPDGRLYFNQSVYIHTHMETPWGMVRLNSGGVFAYDPRTERVEVFARGLWNTWGHVWDDFGQSFLTDGAGRDGINWAFPGATFVAYEGARRIMPSVSPGSYPKFAGLELIKSPHFPAEWQGNVVTCDFRAHRIVRFAITDLSTTENTEGGKQGAGATSSSVSVSSVPSVVKKEAARSGYITTEQPDLVRTSDLSFRPIDVRHGPDGALYIADWSNPVINHGEVDFRDPRRDKHMGRIWRITKKGAPLVKWEPLLGKKNEELLDKLLSKSGWEKEQARKTLAVRLEGHEADFEQAVPAWAGWTQFRGVLPAESALNVEGMWLAKAVGLQNRSFGPAMQLLTNAATPVAGAYPPQVQAAAARILSARPGENPPPSQIETASMAENPRVRLEAMRALARIPSAQSASLVLDAALNQQSATSNQQSTDPHYDFAAWLSINDLAKPWTEAVLKGEWKIAGREKQLEYGLKAIRPELSRTVLARLMTDGKLPLDGSGPWIELIGTAGGPPELQRLLDGLLAGYVGECCANDETRAIDNRLALTQGAADRAAAALLEAARVRNVAPAAHAHLVTALFKSPGVIGEHAVRLAGLWRVPKAADEIGKVIESRETKPPQMRAAIEGLRSVGDARAAELLDQLTRTGEEQGIRTAALVAFTQLKPRAGIARALEMLPQMKDDGALVGAWRGLFGAQGAADAFTQHLATPEAKNLPPAVLTAALRAAREQGRKGEKLVAALTPLVSTAGVTAKVTADYKTLAERAKSDGDPVRGELIYRRAALVCVTCHAIGGAGGKVGPDMTSIGASAPLDYIIESVLDPAVKVKEGYNAVTVTMQDNFQVTGIQSRETATEIFLRDATGREQPVSKEMVKAKTDIGSLMPAGLTDSLKDRERLDLFAFLGQLGRPGPFDASKGSVARMWRLYPGAAVGEVVSATFAPAKNPGFAAFTLVDGRFVKEQLTDATAIAAGSSDTVLLVTQFQSSGKTRLNLTGIANAWLDAQPLVIGGEIAPELSSGTHTLVVKIGVKELPEVLKAESPDARFLTE